jgi:hypothetical protein
MCKWIKYILFPTNVLGKKKKCVSFDTLNTPTIDNMQTFEIEYEGDALAVRYTQFTQRKTPPRSRRYDPIEHISSGGETFEITAPRVDNQRTASNIDNHVIYFNCTNVTKLIVNGEQLI